MTRHRDRLGLVTAAVATVGWAAWVLPDAPRSVPIALVVATVGRRIPTRIGHRDRAVTAAYVLVLAGWVLASVFDPPFAGLVALAGSVAALVTLLYVLPLSVGGLVADRVGVRFPTVVLAWPASLLVGVLVFLAPAPGGVDVTRYNATFLEGPAFVAVLGLATAVVVLGPASVAAGRSRWARR